MKKDINDHLERLDSKLISFASRFSARAGQVALAIIFIWFGGLKLVGLSPAEDLITTLVNTINPLFVAGNYVIGIGVLEVLIGLTILDSDFVRLAIVFLIFHLVLTSLPLFLLPDTTWSSFLIPTFEGQYILKNLLIVVSAMGIIANLSHLSSQKTKTI